MLSTAENIVEQCAAAENEGHRHSTVVAIHPRPARTPRMLKGFCYTPPVIGRIAIGETVEQNGKRIPRKSDEISITAQHKKDGQWVEHPLDAKLRNGKANEKLREIPVRLLFDDPDLSFRESYEAFSGSRQVCVGDGARAKRRGPDGGIEEIECNGPDSCAYGGAHRCKPFARLNVQIDGQDDPLSTFVFRTSGWNSIRTLRSKLEYLYGAFDGTIAGLPLKLVMRGKSTQLSFNTPFFYLDLLLRDQTAIGVAEALEDQKMWRVGLRFNYVGLESAARHGLRNGAFEETQDDAPDIEDWTISSEVQGGNKSLDNVFTKAGEQQGE